MGSAINPDEINRYEVTEVYSHPDAKVDIVLVHGLNGDPRKTWTASNGTFWPTQLLPASLRSAQARILVYGYNADVYTFGGGKGPSSDMIHQHAQTLLVNLSLERKNADTSEHPIIWVAHSLGGILVKRALELSFDLQAKGAEDLRSIYVSTYGIIFLGTPHTGSQIASFGLILEHMVRALVPRKLLESQSQLIKTLQSNNETLQNINLKFLDIYQHRFKVCMVHETQSTDMKGTKALVVDQSSAGPLLPEVIYFGIEATHSGMCKFESKTSPGWVNISVTLRTWVGDAPKIVQGNWELERIQREQILTAQANSILGGIHNTPQQTLIPPNTPDRSLHSSTIIDPQPYFEIPPDEIDKDEPYFIKPTGFRPNSLFVGRQAELSLLHKFLFDKERRAVGTSAVLIQCLPGGGKSHLAREYVYRHKDSFPGGIFWVRAKSEAELIAGFWDIARKAALKELTGVENPEAYRDPQVFIKLVRSWLNHHHEWLLVLDGIYFADVDGLQKFIPDSKNTSLIYTSTERSVSGDHHFMNPQIIRLPQLTAVEAQRLLLLELGRKDPFSQDDLKNSMQLVQAIEFLPVVIHSVAQRMKTTDEPLSKFARSYASQPRLRGLDSYTAVVEQLKAIHAEEALNLMHVLCFFSQHIPVEMISLGLRALEVSVKAREPVTGRSLNNTFKILNTFALIDRNEQDLSISSSRSSKGSRDMLADNVDVIRLHSVVQGFFVDTLAAQESVPVWLDRAVRVFCYSYERANERITRKTNAGLVEDYRLYQIHGNKLKDHLTKFSSKHLHHEEQEILQEGKQLLEEHLEAITSEIDRRTPESTQILAGGKSDIALTSIFDRTSSSSDTASDSPGQYEVDSRISTWGIERDKAQHESPSSIPDKEYIRRMEETYKIHFPRPIEEDVGYESDREEEGSVAMTAKPSNVTVVPHSRTGSWEKVNYRKPRTRIDRLPLHRTVKNLENSRYSDSAGAYRSLRAGDPRLSKETIHGVIGTSPPRDLSRGRISSQSNAVAALAHISKTSPPPARGGGMIQNRSLSRGRVGRRLMAGASSYAAAVAGTIRGSSPGFVELALPEPQSSTDSNSNLDRPRSSAMEALQRFPIEDFRQSSSPHSPYTPRPPYPASPDIRARSENAYFQIPGRFSQEDLSLGPDPFAPNVYPRKDGLPPVESYDGPTPGSFQPRLSDSMPASMYVSHSNLSEDPNPPFLSLSSPNIALHREASDASPYYPGRPELSNLATPVGGYSSQPMSRDPSGQSNKSHISPHGAGLGEGKRRPSVAETEPEPKLPMFSPKIAPTSYQVYERMKEKNLLKERNVDLDFLRSESAAGVGQKKSPQLEYARAALIEKLDDWSLVSNSSSKENNVPSQQARRKFNPTAPSFSPSSSFNPSPRPPSVPANSMFSISNPTTLPNSAATSGYPSPFPSHSFASPPPQNSPRSSIAVPYQSPQSFNTNKFHSSPFPPQNTPLSFTSAQTPELNQGTFGASMERSSSGGVKVGPGKLIAFGDYEPVDYELARERAEVLRNWADREREAERQRRAKSPAISVNQIPRTENPDENVGLGIGVQLPSGK